MSAATALRWSPACPGATVPGDADEQLGEAVLKSGWRHNGRTARSLASRMIRAGAASRRGGSACAGAPGRRVLGDVPVERQVGRLPPRPGRNPRPAKPLPSRTDLTSGPMSTIPTSRVSVIDNRTGPRFSIVDRVLAAFADFAIPPRACRLGTDGAGDCILPATERGPGEARHRAFRGPHAQHSFAASALRSSVCLLAPLLPARAAGTSGASPPRLVAISRTGQARPRPAAGEPARRRTRPCCGTRR
jgi:hypothetical protein